MVTVQETAVATVAEITSRVAEKTSRVYRNRGIAGDPVGVQVASST